MIGFSGYRSTAHLIENDRWVTHTHEVRTKLADLISSLKDAETGQRGFVITADENFLEPYSRSLPEITRTFSELRALTSDNDVQQRRLSSLQPLIDAKLAELKRTIEIRRSAGFEPTMKVVAVGEGKALMDQMRHLITEMDDVRIRLAETSQH